MYGSTNPYPVVVWLGTMRIVLLGWIVIHCLWVQAQMDERPLDNKLPDPSVVAYQSVFELIRLVNGLSQLGQDEALRFTSEQAVAMLAVLGPLSKETNLTPDVASQTTTSLLLLLSAKQLAWWENLKKTQEKLFQKRSAQIRTVGTFTIYHVVVPGYPQLRSLIEQSAAFNPFQIAPNSETFTALVAALQNTQ
jgi:hypothetical protein